MESPLAKIKEMPSVMTPVPIAPFIECKNRVLNKHQGQGPFLGTLPVVSDHPGHRSSTHCSAGSATSGLWSLSTSCLGSSLAACCSLRDQASSHSRDLSDALRALHSSQKDYSSTRGPARL